MERRISSVAHSVPCTSYQQTSDTPSDSGWSEYRSKNLAHERFHRPRGICSVILVHTAWAKTVVLALSQLLLSPKEKTAQGITVRSERAGARAHGTSLVVRSLWPATVYSSALTQGLCCSGTKCRVGTPAADDAVVLEPHHFHYTVQ
jgi:hypothetical protein